MQLRVWGAVALVVGILVGGAAPAAARDGGSGRGNDTSSELRRAVTVRGIKQHELALQLTALATGGNRLAGTRGYDGSASYVASRARRAGLDVSTFEFDYDLYALADWKPPVLRERRGERYIPGIAGSVTGGDFGSMVNSPSGDITAPVWAADLTLPSPAPNSSDSGCEAADFAGMPAGAIVLVQRGTCGTLNKWLNAQAAGAGAIVYINEGNPGDPDRVDPQWFDVEGVGLEIPVMAAQVATVERLADGVAQGLVGTTARLRIDWRTGTYPTRNVIAETRGGDPDKVILVGAHLDSVGTGPGINDNGSGSSGILEIAEQLRGVYPRNKIRFVWFSAEESGLLGSEAYVASLPPEERQKIAAMLNFDMIGSPNFVRFVYDGDLSDSPPINEATFAPEARPFSATIEGIFLDYFERQGTPDAADRLRRSLGLRAVHRRRRPCRRTVHGCRGREDTGAGGRLRRHRRRVVRPLLPPGLRRPEQPEQHGAGPDVGRRGARHHHAGAEPQHPRPAGAADERAARRRNSQQGQGPAKRAAARQRQPLIQQDPPGRPQPARRRACLSWCGGPESDRDPPDLDRRLG